VGERGARLLVENGADGLARRQAHAAELLGEAGGERRLAALGRAEDAEARRHGGRRRRLPQEVERVGAEAALGLARRQEVDEGAVGGGEWALLVVAEVGRDGLGLQQLDGAPAAEAAQLLVAEVEQLGLK